MAADIVDQINSYVIRYMIDFLVFLSGIGLIVSRPYELVNMSLSSAQLQSEPSLCQVCCAIGCVAPWSNVGL